MQSVSDSLHIGPVSVPVDWQAVTGRAGTVLLVLVLAWIGWRLVLRYTRRIEAHAIREQEETGLLTPERQRARTVAQLVRNVAMVGLVVLVVMTILNMFIPIGPLIAGASIFGLAGAFGAQSLVRDVISGAFMLLEGQFAVGDVIRVNNETAGMVERLTLRIVVLRDVQGVVHIIPNGEIKQVSNLTKEWSRAFLEMGVAYGEDVDRVIEALRELGREIWQDPEWNELLLAEPEVPGVERFEDSAVVIRLMAKTRPLKQWDVMRELRRRIKNRFDELGIEIPFPHRTLYWGRGQASDERSIMADEAAPEGGRGDAVPSGATPKSEG